MSLLLQHSTNVHHKCGILYVEFNYCIPIRIHPSATCQYGPNTDAGGRRVAGLSAEVSEYGCSQKTPPMPEWEEEIKLLSLQLWNCWSDQWDGHKKHAIISVFHGTCSSLMTSSSGGTLFFQTPKQPPIKKNIFIPNACALGRKHSIKRGLRMVKCI